MDHVYFTELFKESNVVTNGTIQQEIVIDKLIAFITVLFLVTNYVNYGSVKTNTDNKFLRLLSYTHTKSWFNSFKILIVKSSYG